MFRSIASRGSGSPGTKRRKSVAVPWMPQTHAVSIHGPTRLRILERCMQRASPPPQRQHSVEEKDLHFLNRNATRERARAHATAQPHSRGPLPAACGNEATQSGVGTGFRTAFPLP